MLPFVMGFLLGDGEAAIFGGVRERARHARDDGRVGRWRALLPSVPVALSITAWLLLGWKYAGQAITRV
jgi:hypothetical protein